jgi:hypothetical protein
MQVTKRTSQHIKKRGSSRVTFPLVMELQPTHQFFFGITRTPVNDFGRFVRRKEF